MQQNNFNYVPKNQFSSYFNSPYTQSQGVSTSTNNIIWVQGIEGAKAWQLSPNSMAILLDSEAEGKMYIKVSDNIGMSTLRTFNYVEEVSVPTSNVTINQDLDLSQYVKKDELSALIREVLAKDESTLSTTGGNSGISDPTPAQPKTIILSNNKK